MYDNTYNDRDGITGLAAGFLEAQDAGSFVEPPSVTHRLRLGDAYRVGAEIARTRLRSGWRQAGWKVGFTNREIWPRWGLDRPIIAPVYRETIFRGPHGAAGPPHLSVPMGTRASARLEVEVVFGFADVPEPGAVAGTWGDPAWIALGVELVDCHYAGWRLHPADGVADSGLHAALIVGPPVPLPTDRGGGAGLPRALPQMKVSLSGNGEPLAQGRGDAVLGSPFNVLAELDRSLKPAMAAYPAPRAGPAEGDPGYLVSTGTLTPLVEARIGTTYEVEADLLPSFSFVLA